MATDFARLEDALRREGRPMMAGILTGGLFVIGSTCAVLFAMRQRFMSRLDALEQAIRENELVTGPRSDLPPDVVALPARLGAKAEGGARFAVCDQSGQMWQTPGGKAKNSTARQTVGVGTTEFIWRAKMGKPVSVAVADDFVGGTGGLEVRLFGAIPLDRMVGGVGANQGEALRYLAELPWNPDAILSNVAMDWTVVGPTKIRVATGIGADRGEVTFDLDERGLIERANAPSRLYVEKGGVTARPWHGRFWDYERIEGRLMPRQGEVAWVLEAGDFVYWRGRILTWRG